MQEIDVSGENEKGKYCCIKAVFKPFIWINDLASKAAFSTTNAMLGGALGDIINQGQKNKVSEYDYMKSEYHETLEKFNEEYPTLKCENFKLDVDKKTSLQTIDIKNSNNKENNYLVVFMGNAEMLEGRIRRLAKMSKDFNCNIRSFNFRGKGESTGRAKKTYDLVEDGKAQVESLLKNGVEPEKITLYGKCMGAAIGVLIAKDMHRKDLKVKVALDLPFSKLTSMYLGMLRLQKIPNKNVKNLRRKKFTLKTYTPFVRTAIKTSKWEMDVKEAYKSIPDDYKMFLQIRSRDQVNRTENFFGDGVVADEASLGYSLEKELLKEQDILKSKINKLEKKISKFESKSHKIGKDIEVINSFKTKNSEFKEAIKRIDDKLSELQKTEIKEEENLLNEDYKELSNKQKCIRVIHKIDNILPRVLDIARELGEMRTSISRDVNIDGIEELKNLKSTQETIELDQKYGKRRSEIEKSLVDISYQIRNEQRKPDDPYQIEDIDTFAYGMANALINKLTDTVRYVMDMPELRVSECMHVLVENNGLIKLGHNKDLKDLHYVHEDISADIALNRFINKPMKIERLRSKSTDKQMTNNKGLEQ